MRVTGVIRGLLAVAVLAVPLAGGLSPATAQAIEPGEVRPYEEVFAIDATAVSRDRVEVTWTIAEDYYLYDNQFLSFETSTPGVTLGAPELPPGKASFDELLGKEVVKYRDRMTVGLPLTAVPPGLTDLVLEVRSQGCLETVLCYPPTRQRVTVTLPAANAVPAPIVPGATAVSPLEQLLSGQSPGAGPAGSPMMDKAPALPPEEAFVYEAIGLNAETVLVRFTAQPGYYLYVDKFAFRTVGAPGFEVREVALPTGTIKDDPEFGPVPVIYDQVEIPVRLNRPAGPERSLTLEADWQGCRDGDICYPPQTGRVTLQLAGSQAAIDRGAPPAEASGNDGVAGPAPGAVAPVSEQSRLASLLTDNPPAALLAFFFAGLLLAFTPCVFPMVPILSGIIAGEGDKVTPMRAFWLSLIYVLAMAATYTVAGVLAGLFGKNLQAMFQAPWVIVLFVAVFVALALAMFGVFHLQLPHRWQSALHDYSSRHKGGKFGGVAMLGIFSALIVGPCVAPPLAAALIVIGESGSPTLGGSALFSLSLGMGVPLIVFGVTAGEFLPRAGHWMNVVKDVFGVGLLALAVWMLERILPGAVIMLLWGMLAIGCGVYLRALERIPEDASGWRRLWKALGLVLLLLGAVEIIGAASGGSYWLRPLEHLRGVAAGAGPQGAEHVEFERIKSLDDLDGAVARANAAGKPAMLDFYADWCVECIRMERNTFPKPGVQALLTRIQPLQADVTPHDEIDQALMAEFGVIGPPAILFFDRRGREMPAYRLVGYFDEDEFVSHLQAVLEAQ